MLCFAVFLGSWSPLSTTGISLPSLSNPASKGAVDYSTPSGKEQFKERRFDNTGDIAVPWVTGTGTVFYGENKRVLGIVHIF